MYTHKAAFSTCRDMSAGFPGAWSRYAKQIAIFAQKFHYVKNISGKIKIIWNVFAFFRLIG